MTVYEGREVIVSENVCTYMIECYSVVDKNLHGLKNVAEKE